MKAEDAGRFAEALEKMFQATLHRNPGKVEQEAYWEALEDLDIERVVSGMLTARREKESGFCPTDGEVYAAATKAKYAAPYHARLLPPPVAQPWTPEQLADWDALDERMRARLKMSDEVLSPRQWPDSKGMK